MNFPSNKIKRHKYLSTVFNNKLSMFTKHELYEWKPICWKHVIQIPLEKDNTHTLLGTLVVWQQNDKQNTFATLGPVEKPVGWQEWALLLIQTTHPPTADVWFWSKIWFLNPKIFSGPNLLWHPKKILDQIFYKDQKKNSGPNFFLWPNCFGDKIFWQDTNFSRDTNFFRETHFSIV